LSLGSRQRPNKHYLIGVFGQVDLLLIGEQVLVVDFGDE